jgi:hypothetical protein
MVTQSTSCSQEDASKGVYYNPLSNLSIRENGIIETDYSSGLFMPITTHGKLIAQEQIIDVDKFNDEEFKKLATAVAYHTKYMSRWTSYNGSISSLAPLQPFSSILSLDLSRNKLTTIEDLPFIQTLEILYLRDNEIIDISALSKCLYLKQVYLTNNCIKNVTALKNRIKNLQNLEIERNPLEAKSVYRLIRKREEKETVNAIHDKGASEVLLYLYRAYSDASQRENENLKEVVAKQKRKITVLKEDTSHKRPRNYTKLEESLQNSLQQCVKEWVKATTDFDNDTNK